jgi:hypothetical protein
LLATTLAYFTKDLENLKGTTTLAYFPNGLKNLPRATTSLFPCWHGINLQRTTTLAYFSPKSGGQRRRKSYIRLTPTSPSAW